MPAFPPELEEVLQSHQRQIDEINTARPGPTSYGPGDGHLRFYTSTGDTFHVAATGAQVKHRGALTGLTPHLEANTSKQEQQDGTLSTHGTRLDSYSSSITSLGGRVGTAEIAIDGLRTSKADVTYVDTKASTATVNSIRDDLQGQLNTKAAVTYVDTKASQSSLNAVSSRTSDAQARADAAYSLASSRASSSDVSTAVTTAKQYTDSRINALVTALRNQGIPIVI